MINIVRYYLKQYRKKKEDKKELEEQRMKIAKEIAEELSKEEEAQLEVQHEKNIYEQKTAIKKWEEEKRLILKKEREDAIPEVEDVRAHIKHLDTYQRNGLLKVHTAHNANHLRIAKNKKKFGAMFTDKLNYAVASKTHRIDRTLSLSGKNFQELDLTRLVNDLEDHFYKQLFNANFKV